MRSSVVCFDRFCRQFVDWAKQHSHSPITGIDPFINGYSDQRLRRIARRLETSSQVNARELLRWMLIQFIERTDVAMGFPVIYLFPVDGIGIYRYSLMLVANNGYVEWTARVWCGSQYQGILTGRGRGIPEQHPTALARLAVEGELFSPMPQFS